MKQVPSEIYPPYPLPSQLYPPAPEERGVHFRTYWGVMQSRKWLIASFVVIAVIVAAVKIFTTTSVYRGTATLQVNVESPQIVEFKEVFRVNMWANDYYQTQYKILESRKLARRVIQDLKLREHSAFQPQPPTVFQKLKSQALHSLADFLRSLSLVPPSKRGTPQAGRESRANEEDSTFVDAFLGSLSIEPVKESRIVKIHYTSRSPDLAGQIPNAVAASLIELNRESKVNTSEQARKWLSRQLEEMKAKVEKSDEELQAFGSSHGMLSAADDRTNITMGRLSELNETLTKAESERIAKEAFYKQVKQDKQQGTDWLPSILENRLVQELKNQYIQLEGQYGKLSETFHPNYPELVRLKAQMETVQKRLNAEVNKVVIGIKADYESALRKEFLLRTAFEQQKERALAMQQSAIQYNILRREAETNKELYKSLLQRMKEIGVSAALNPSNIEIIDQAEVPRSPYNPNAHWNLLIAAIVGLFLGTAMALFFEYFDSTIKTPEDVEQLVQLPSFGMVPEIAYERRMISQKDKKYPVELVSYGHPKSMLSEAYRNIRTSLLLSFSKTPPRTIVVTSPSPLEGKTTTMINTAISLSLTGARVLMIDSDMRKPRVHKIFSNGNGVGDHKKNGVGLSSFLSGQANLWSVVHKSALQDLYYIPSGPIPPNPSELLCSSLFKEMMHTLQERFDHILIDSPPVIGFADSVILSTLSDGVMLVVLGGKTPREALQRAKDAILQVEAKILGVVINRVDIRRSDYGYYYYRYYYYYGEDGKKRKKIPHLSGRRDSRELRSQEKGRSQARIG